MIRFLKNLFARKDKASPSERQKRAYASLNFKIVQPQSAEWVYEDVIKLRQFLTTGTGKKLVLICGSEIIQQAMKEVNGDSTMARASGMDGLLRFQFNLASEKMSDKLSQKISRSAGAQAETQPPGDSELNDADLPEIRSF